MKLFALCMSVMFTVLGCFLIAQLSVMFFDTPVSYLVSFIGGGFCGHLGVKTYYRLMEYK